MAFDLTQLPFSNLRMDDGDTPPQYTLVLTEEELDYLHEIMLEEADANGDIPEIMALCNRLSRLKGFSLEIV